MVEAGIASIFAKLDGEVFVLTASDGARHSGQIVTWVLPATIVPEVPRVLVGVGRLTFTREVMEASRRFALNLLGHDQWRWVPHFGFRSGRDVEKFAGISFRRGSTGSPLLPDTVGYLECHTRSVMDGGAHLFYLGDVVAGDLVSEREPLRVHHLSRVLSPEELGTMRRLLERDIVEQRSLL
jgi:flavin reductase (DIM6/NTAB) family NADH-FMN oxidoreductase RutF